MAITGAQLATNSGTTTMMRIGKLGTAASYTGPPAGGPAFDNYSVWGKARRCNVWDDGTITAYYGKRCYTDTDVSNMGQVMDEFEPFLWWVDTSGSNSLRFYIGDLADIGKSIPLASGWGSHQLTADDVHPAFMVDGYQVSKAYLGAYEAYLSSANIIGSKAEATPILGTVSNADLRTYTEARGVGWRLMTIQALAMARSMFILEYANLNFEAIGYGMTGMSGVSDTGGTVSAGNSNYGTTGNYTTPTSYRGLENLTGNAGPTVIEGLTIKSSSRNVWVAPQSRTWAYTWASLTDPYVDTGAVMVDASAGGYMSAILTSISYFIPSAIGGSNSTYYCDKVTSLASGDMLLFAGGAYGDGRDAGIFAQKYYTSDFLAGARIQYMPKII